MNFGPGPATSINLQATLSAASSGSSEEMVRPHHPISCMDDLAFQEDGTLECKHASANDQRVRSCLNHTAAILLFELVFEKFGMPTTEGIKLSTMTSA